MCSNPMRKRPRPMKITIISPTCTLLANSTACVFITHVRETKVGASLVKVHEKTGVKITP